MSWPLPVWIRTVARPGREECRPPADHAGPPRPSYAEDQVRPLSRSVVCSARCSLRRSGRRSVPSRGNSGSTSWASVTAASMDTAAPGRSRTVTTQSCPVDGLYGVDHRVARPADTVVLRQRRRRPCLRCDAPHGADHGGRDRSDLCGTLKDVHVNPPFRRETRQLVDLEGIDRRHPPSVLGHWHRLRNPDTE